MEWHAHYCWPLTLSVHGVTVPGEKRKPFRGPEKIAEQYRRAVKLNKLVNQLEKQMGAKEYKNRRDQLEINLGNPFNDTMDNNVVNHMAARVHHKHKRSAKEKVKGHDKAPLTQGKIPLGKIHQNVGNNFNLLKMELLGRWKARDGAKYDRALTPDEINVLTEEIGVKGIKKVKEEIWADEMKRWLAEDAERRAVDFKTTYLTLLFTERCQYIYETIKKK